MPICTCTDLLYQMFLCSMAILCNYILLYQGYTQWQESVGRPWDSNHGDLGMGVGQLSSKGSRQNQSGGGIYPTSKGMSCITMIFGHGQSYKWMDELTRSRMIRMAAPL